MHNIFAAIDLGSNSFHMIVGRYEAGQFIILDKLREMVRLASGLDEEKKITPEMMQKALDCLSRFGERIRHLDADVVRIVGTNTLRQARNSTQFMRQAEGVLGHPIEIISGIEEARLIYSGVSHNVDVDNGKRLVVDIGGGSTEIIIGERFQPILMESLYMGCVSMSKRFFSSGSITQKKVDKAGMYAMMQLEPHIKAYKKLGWQDSIGASGTARAIRSIAIEEGLSEQGITNKSLKSILDKLIQAGSIDDISLEGLKAERKPVIIGGVIVLNAIFNAFDVEHMTISDGALREGILYDLVGRDENNDSRTESVETFAQRFVMDHDQSERVIQTAMQLFDQTKDEWLKEQEQEDARKHLEWAARLHEVGLCIAHSQYNKHGAYMVGQADLMGFSRQDQKLLAALIQLHRRSLQMDLFDEIDSGNKKIGKRLVIILRLAALLNRSRADTPPPLPDISVDKKTIQLRFEENWLQDHALTQSDLEAEISYLEKAGYQLIIQ
jgi:exopolyphosphatase/guanosine-5'-triphosphate,3'-diphosphate pyrophosphatase